MPTRRLTKRGHLEELLQVVKCSGAGVDTFLGPGLALVNCVR